MADEVTLVDESGVERRFALHDAFELDGQAFYLVEDVDQPERVLLLRETQTGLETLDGEEFSRVMNALEKDEIE